MAEQQSGIEGGAEVNSGSKMKPLVLGVIAVVILAIGIVAGPMVKNMISPPEAAEGAEGADANSAREPAIFQSLHPPLVVNFTDSSGDSHFMQVTMEVMSREQDVINAVRDHTPIIRNSLILLYSGADYEDVTTREGKERMLEDGLAEIRSVMAGITDAERIEAVYFTGLVIQ